jgi:hypothetical protein
MKRVLIATLSVVAVGLGGVAWASGSGGTAGKPMLVLVETSPLTVRGINFEATEHVSVTVRGQARSRRALEAGKAGAFVARFPNVSVDDCQGFSVLAVGSDGSRASLSRRPGPCAPGPAEG